MKKIISVLLILTLIFVFTACRENVENGENTTTQGTSQETAVSEEETEETTEEASTEEENTEEETTEEETTAEEATEEETAASDSGPDLTPINQYMDTTGGDWTAEDWIAQASRIYKTACETFFTYVNTSSWLEVDYSAPTVNEHYFKVTNFDSKAEAEAEFFSVFTYNGFATALDEKLIEKDGVLYAAIADRGADVSYEGFEITEIQDVSDGKITFTAVNRYDTGLDPQPFTLRYERGVFRVDGFILPY